MEKLDRLGRIFNWILGGIYCFLSPFCWLMMMVSEGTMDASNPLYITLIQIFCGVCFVLPLLFALAIVLSVIFRRKGRSVLAFVTQFLPLGIFILNWVLLIIADSLPRKI